MAVRCRRSAESKRMRGIIGDLGSVKLKTDERERERASYGRCLGGGNRLLAGAEGETVELPRKNLEERERERICRKSCRLKRKEERYVFNET